LSSSTGISLVPQGISMVSTKGRTRRLKVERLMPSAAADAERRGCLRARVGEALDAGRLPNDLERCSVPPRSPPPPARRFATASTDQATADLTAHCT